MKMAVLVLMASVLLAMAAPSSGAYCVCKQGVSDGILQKAIDYACGAGADCTGIRPNGQCYNPNTMLSHCSYAVNNYYQRKASSGATCDFQGAATLTNAAPSGGCSYSGASGSTGTGATGPVTTVPSTSPPTGTTPATGTTPTGTTPTTGATPTTTPVSGGTGTGTSVGVTPTTGTTPTTTSPYSTTPTPNSGMLGGGGIGLAPSGSSMDENASGIERTSLSSIVAAIMISGIICWWN